MQSEKLHILLCDDDRDIVEVTRLILEERYIVDVFYQGDEIVEAAQRIKPAVIILDLWMPGQGGEETAVKLKKDPLTENIPIILFSAANSLRKVADSINVEACIAKPYDIDYLMEVVDRCISTSASASAKA